MFRLSQDASRVGVRLLGHLGYRVTRTDARRRAAILRNRHVDVVLDVGAAVGSYGRELRACGYRGAIESYEPLSAQFERLRRASAGDPHWRVHQVAISDRTGTGELQVTANLNSSSLLRMEPRHVEAAPHSRPVGVETVRLDTLDNAVMYRGEHWERPFLKIDVQGAERMVLSGAQVLVERLCGVQLEVSFVPLYDGGMRVLEALDWLDAHGFVIAGVEPGFRDACSGDLLQADFIAFRPASGDRDDT